MIPDDFAAGTTFEARYSALAHPAGEWAATLILRGPTQIDIIGTADGAQHVFSASAAATAGWPPGGYWWAIRAVRGAEVVQIDDGQIRVAVDLSTLAGPHDGRSHAERVLASIEAVIEGRATTDQQKYTINNRELWRTPIADLLLLRARYRDEVRRQQQARGGQSLLGRQVKVRF